MVMPKRPMSPLGRKLFDEAIRNMPQTHKLSVGEKSFFFVDEITSYRDIQKSADDMRRLIGPKITTFIARPSRGDKK